MNRLFQIIAFAILIVSNNFLSADDIDTEKEQFIIDIILQNLTREHFNPIEINDQYSNDVFDYYLEKLDRNKMFLLQKDVVQLTKYQDSIDDEIKNHSLGLLDESTAIIEERIEACDAYYKEVLAVPFDFSVAETYESDYEKLNWCANGEELKDRWRQYLKFQTIKKINSLEKENITSIDSCDTIPLKSFDLLEIEAREKIVKQQDNWFRRMGQVNRSDRFATYVNALINPFDPHTAYFPPKDKEDFDIRISGRLEGIGARLVERDGNIRISEIIPGSPSAKQGELEPEDIILKVAQGSDEPVDVENWRLDEAVQLIRGEKGSEVRLTVMKIDGSQKIIPIIRDIVILEESYAKSAIIEDETSDRKVGYIYLPKFYTDFTKTGGRTCSEDIRKELVKLKNEDVDELVFDLRNNGGGSLRDVIKIVGLFIDEGPVVQVLYSDDKTKIHTDYDSDVIFDGELVVLVNSFSASASEILAAAIQDYNRGVIIGSTATYGKGTVQRFLNFDDPRYSARLPEHLKGLGSLKLTTQKFYRINGGATQLKGVTPDIILPDNYSYIDIGEKELDFALAWSEIEAVAFNEWDLNDELVAVVLDESTKRVESDTVFVKLNENAKRLKSLRDKTAYSLNWEQFILDEEKKESESNQYKHLLDTKLDDISIRALAVDQMEIEKDSLKLDRYNKWIENLEKDVYIKEALEVLDDIQ